MTGDSTIIGGGAGGAEKRGRGEPGVERSGRDAAIWRISAGVKRRFGGGMGVTVDVAIVVEVEGREGGCGGERREEVG